ncbi:PaaI family thioesterase [Leucobacter sp. M11]|uniref:PaaI family thioesterase n=1 Tax=Leucobacter sp. M11 TaxID=2993565 RepID=UPI002D802A17|nr:PaaI family thioesterase [Leucobacter sp. M11]MEB4613502.1 PaaI family thioesterase [Leucobacter sp. M11]
MNDARETQPDPKQPPLPVLDYLSRMIAGTLRPGDRTHFDYPSPINRLLGFEVLAVSEGTAVLGFAADAAVHGNQQGTVHGGMLAELADASIGTAHSTLLDAGESLTSIDLRVTYLRPVWREHLRATARASHLGRTISHYDCEITRADGQPVARATSTVLTLRGEAAAGR